jgi:hypothetical protein
VRAGRDVEPVGLLVAQVDKAKVGERLNGHFGDVQKRLFDFERAVEHLACAYEKLEALVGTVD